MKKLMLVIVGLFITTSAYAGGWGVSVNIGIPFYTPAPVVYTPAPVVYTTPVYLPRQVIYSTAPVVYVPAPAPVVYPTPIGIVCPTPVTVYFPATFHHYHHFRH
jgi:hypothetical protein